MSSLIELALTPAPLAPPVIERDIALTLTGHEPMIARLIGDDRDTESRRVTNDAGGMTPVENRKRSNIHAVGAEIAAARFLNLYPYAFSGRPGAVGRGDVGDLQVRQTRTDCLYLYAPGNPFAYRPTDPFDTYVLVVGELPQYCIVGWIVARDGMRDEYWRTDLRCPCWAIPRGRMRSFLNREAK